MTHSIGLVDDQLLFLHGIRAVVDLSLIHI